jgi:uncharacterized membrane protein
VDALKLPTLKDPLSALIGLGLVVVGVAFYAQNQTDQDAVARLALMVGAGVVVLALAFRSRARRWWDRW